MARGKMIVHLTKSNSKGKKFKAIILNSAGKKVKTVHFGATGYSDFTKHKDKDRKQRYINRHKKREKWGKNGIKTAGFWSRWILWNKPTLAGSIRNTASKFGITIKRTAYKPKK